MKLNEIQWNEMKYNENGKRTLELKNLYLLKSNTYIYLYKYKSNTYFYLNT